MKLKMAFLYGLLFVLGKSFSQDTIYNPSHYDLKPVHIVLVIDNIFITDTSVSYSVLKKYSDLFRKRRYLTPRQGFKKFEINSIDGIVICYLKRKITIDTILKSIRNEDYQYWKN
jgi:hypothetical protein